MHWTVGKVKITKIVELETIGSTRFILPLASNEEIRKLPWLIPHFATEEGRLKMSIHSLVVETPSRRIVVDTGLGNDKEGRNVPTWNNRKGPFLETMTEAGFAPDSIDTVLCTHLHVDHVGWNTNWSAANGCRPSPMRAMCSARPNTSIGGITAMKPTRPRCSTIP